MHLSAQICSNRKVATVHSVFVKGNRKRSHRPVIESYIVLAGRIRKELEDAVGRSFNSNAWSVTPSRQRDTRDGSF